MAVPLRVAMATYSRPGDIGGVTTWFYGLARALHDRGMVVGILLLHEGEDDVADSSLAQDLISAGLDVQLVAARRSFVANVKLTIDYLNRWRPTVFLPQCLPDFFVAAAMAGQRGLPWAYTIHSDDHQYWSSLSALMPQWSGGEIVCVSRYLAAEVQRRCREAVATVIPYGVRVPPVAVVNEGPCFRVAYSGRIEEGQKRISLVIEALILACRQDGRIQARLIGAGSSLESLRQRVRKEGLDHVIQFCGRVDSGDVPMLLSDCQSLLLMSDYEGLPVALLEAMAQGLVPVARCIASGVPELVLPDITGLQVSDDPAEAAAAIARLAADPALWERCQRGGRDLISRAYAEPVCHGLWEELVERLHARSRVVYPLAVPALGLRASLNAALIDLLWSLLERRAAFALATDTVSARIKHQIRRWLPGMLVARAR